MKNVLVLMHDDAGQEARFQAALDLARALGGHLTCLDVEVVPSFAGDYGVTGGEAFLIADEQQREVRNRAHMEERLKVEDVPYDWVTESGFLSPCVRDTAALTDVIVLNRELDSIDYPDMRELVGEVVIKSARPIVAVPEDSRGFDASGHALIAWDGSKEAEAALRAAVPLLQLAAGVTILQVGERPKSLQAEEAAEYLSRHGIKPMVMRESSAVDLPSSLILDKIVQTKSSYLVMGGFGHSRFREAALGGVTRRMLQECPVPLFLAH